MENKMDDGGKLVLRVVLAVLILFHGVSKLIGGVGFISGMLVKAGLPGALGYLVYVGEVIAPLLVLFGVFTRAAALIVAVNMIVALVLVHTRQFFTLSATALSRSCRSRPAKGSSAGTRRTTPSCAAVAAKRCSTTSSGRVRWVS